MDSYLGVVNVSQDIWSKENLLVYYTLVSTSKYGSE